MFISQFKQKKEKTNPNILHKKATERLITDYLHNAPDKQCTDKTDITRIHQYIISYLQDKKKKTIPLLEEKKKEIETSLSLVRTHIEYRNIEKEIEKINEAIEIIQNEEIINEYKMKVEEIIAEWKQHVLENKISNSNNVNPERLFLVSSYISIAEKYIPEIKFDIIKPNRGDVCSTCWKQMENYDAFLFCSNCNEYRPLLYLDYASETMKTEIKPTTNNYLNRETYEKFLINYECLQDPGWNPETNPKWNINIMLNYFIQYCTQEGINISSVSPKDVVKIFSTITSVYNLPFNKQYNNAILFTHLLNGWPKPSLYGQKDELLKDHEEFYTVYPEFKDKRESAMNCPFIHLKFMQRRGIPYNIEDFKLAETTKILAENDKIASKCFAKLEEMRIKEGRDNDIPWKYIDTV